MIFGAGGLGRELAWLVGEINARQARWKLLGFFDDDPSLWGSCVAGLPVLAKLPTASHVVCAIGDPQAKARVVARLHQEGFSFATLAHPGVPVSASVTVGQGSVLMPGAVLTVDIHLGEQVLLSPGCTVGHDTCIGDLCSLMPGAHLAGSVTLGERVLVGMGAVVLKGVRVGDDTVLGAGAVATADLPAGVVAVGVPARVVRAR